MAENSIFNARSRLLYLFILYFFIFLLCYSIRAGAEEAATTVATNNGVISGFEKDGIYSFLGIPYASPPTGELRWRPPRTVLPWNGVLAAINYGNSCPQNRDFGVFSAPSVTEDCLYLNVFTPRLDPKAKLPVIVWIHGGGLSAGRSNDYDVSRLVVDGNSIVVTFNYRLGVLGFFALPALDNENHKFANYGIMDQQFALRWVQKNIAAFGGDPKKVTIAGESAGGASVLANMVSPAAAGLFSKAISQSGSYLAINGVVPDLANAEKLGGDYAVKVGCSGRVPAKVISCLRKLSVKEVLRAQMNYVTSISVDGSIIPTNIKDAFIGGKFNHVPIINGSDRDEWRWSVALSEIESHKPLTYEKYKEELISTYGSEGVDRILKEYPINRYSSLGEALGAIETDWLMACSAVKVNDWLSRYVPVYAYEFNDRSSPSYMAPVIFPYGAAHTFELQYIFPYFHGATGVRNSLNAGQSLLSKKMISYWTSFSKNGHPSGPGDSAVWLQEQGSGFDRILLFGVGDFTTKSSFSEQHHCAFWDSISVY